MEVQLNPELSWVALDGRLLHSRAWPCLWRFSGSAQDDPDWRAIGTPWGFLPPGPRPAVSSARRPTSIFALCFLHIEMIGHHFYVIFSPFWVRSCHSELPEHPALFSSVHSSHWTMAAGNAFDPSSVPGTLVLTVAARAYGLQQSRAGPETCQASEASEPLSSLYLRTWR